MRRRGPAQLVVIAGLLLTCFTALAADGIRDMARYLPADTAIYAGWSVTPNEKCAAEAEQLVGLVHALVTDIDDEGKQVFEYLAELGAAAMRGHVGLGLIDVTIGEGGPVPQAVLVMNVGDKATELAAKLDALLARLSGQTIAQEDLGGARLNVLQHLDEPIFVCWGVHKDCFVLTLSRESAKRVIACMNGTAPSLADDPEFKADRQKVGAQLDTDFACIYANVRRVLTRAREIAQQVGEAFPPQVDALIHELGIDSVVSKYGHYQRVKDMPRLAVFAHVDGELRGLLSVWKQDPLTDDDLKIIPQDAYWAHVGNFDLAKLWLEGLRVVEAVVPDLLPQIQGAPAMVSPILGFSPIDELLPALGDTWAIYDAPAHGGIFFSGTVLTVDVRNPEFVKNAMARVVQMAAGLLGAEGVNITQKQATHGGHEVFYVLIAGVPCPVAPSWGFAGGRCVFGLQPQTVAAALKQVDPATRGPSLLDHPDVKAARPQLPQPAVSFGYFNSKYIARMIYPVLNLISTLAASMGDGKNAVIDFDMSPLVDEYVASLHSCVSHTAVEANGIYYTSIGDGSQVMLGSAAGAALGASVALPSLARARAQAKSAVSMSNLRGIGMACMIYANDHADQLPASLDDLLADGSVSEKQLRSPFDPSDDRSYVLIPHKDTLGRMQSPSSVVLAFEPPREDGRVRILFADAHVESKYAFEAAGQIREACTAAGIPDKIPPELAQ